MTGALKVYASLSREFFLRSRAESLDALRSLQDFFALALRYPVIPRLVADAKECPECYFEADITLDTWEETKVALSCYHFTVRHECYAPVPDCGSIARGGTTTTTTTTTRESLKVTDPFAYVTDPEVVRAVPCGEAFPESRVRKRGDETGGCPAGFLEQLEWLKTCDEIAKQRALGREVSRQMDSYAHTLGELEAPRYLSSHPLRWLYRTYGSLNRSADRARVLDEPYAERCADVARARGATDGLLVSLLSAASTGNNDELLSSVCAAALDPARRYARRYGTCAERIVFFKHLVANGFSVETAAGLVRSVSSVARASLIGLSASQGVERQLRKTQLPTAYNRKIASLTWLFAHTTAYCTLRGLPRGYVLMADSPKDLREDGIYVFDEDRVGFRLSDGDADTGVEGWGRGRVASALVSFEGVLELLALRDIVHERLCGQTGANRC